MAKIPLTGIFEHFLGTEEITSQEQLDELIAKLEREAALAEHESEDDIREKRLVEIIRNTPNTYKKPQE